MASLMGVRHPIIHSGCIAALLLSAIFAGCEDVEVYRSTSLREPPEAVTDASLRLDDADGAAILTWTAPHPRGGTEALRRYDIRYSYSEAFEWDTALRVTTSPVPGEPGTPEVYRFIYPERGRVLAAQVRTIDVSGNVSAAGNVASVHVPGYRVSGRVREILGGESAAARVTISAGETTRETTTDAAGNFLFVDLPEALVSLQATGSDGQYFPVELELTLIEDVDIDLDMIGYGVSDVYPSLSRLTLFKEAVGLRASTTVLRTWTSRPVDVYVPEYTNSFGLDYGATALAAIGRWIELTGVDLFRVVAEPPARGVTMTFRSPAEMGVQNGYTEHVNDLDGSPLRSDISIVNSFSSPIALNRVMLHELGHTIRLAHLPAGFLMYGGQPLPNDPTDDEIWIVRLLAAFTDGTDLSIYREVSE